MNKYLLGILVFLFKNSMYATLGYNNVMISLGGGYSTGQIASKNIPTLGEYYVDNPGYEISGGTLTVEVGYLLQGVTYKNGIVNSLDIRANFSTAWLNNTVYSDPRGHISQQGIQLGGGGMIAYGLGVVTEEEISEQSSRIIFDITGIGFSRSNIPFTKTLYFNDSSKPTQSKSFNVNTFALEFVLPGMYYIHRTGFMVGWRNTLQMNLEADSGELPFFNYKANFYLGFVFGN